MPRKGSYTAKPSLPASVFPSSLGEQSTYVYESIPPREERWFTEGPAIRSMSPIPSCSPRMSVRTTPSSPPLFKSPTPVPAPCGLETAPASPTASIRSASNRSVTTPSQSGAPSQIPDPLQWSADPQPSGTRAGGVPDGLWFKTDVCVGDSSMHKAMLRV